MAKRFHDILLGARVLTRGVSDPNASIDSTRSLQLELTKLWRCVVGPILDSLGYTNANSRSASHTPHVVWCPSGPLCFLPLHAAGVYLDNTGDVGSLNRAIDLIVSSYTPSLSSLLRSPENPIAAERTLKRILAVSQSDPPGWPRIPLTYNEVFTIRDLVGVEKLQWLDDKAATVEAVLGMLKAEECSCIHLACHGVQDSVDPLQSGFVLHDGKMTLREIMGLDISRKELAILSACETATGDSTSPEEALHLAAGMLMAGYANVVGTMWSIQDEDAPVVVRELYAHLIDSGGNSQVAEGSVARALHDAVRALRAKVGERNFVRWMPFIHYGL